MPYKMPLEGRIALYDYRKERQSLYRAAAFHEMGDSCDRCGSDVGLRIRFCDADDPLALKYRTNPVTLHRRICTEPEIRERVHLLCRRCRLAGK